MYVYCMQIVWKDIYEKVFEVSDLEILELSLCISIVEDLNAKSSLKEIKEKYFL